jgi:hypothetical protein
MRNVKMGTPFPYKGRLLLPGETHPLPDDIAAAMEQQNFGRIVEEPAEPRSREARYNRRDMRARE